MADNEFYLGPKDPECFPNGYIQPGGETTACYSPGICPHGYTIISSTVETSGTFTETQASCCPSKYTTSSPYDWCLKPLTKNEVVTFVLVNGTASKTHVSFIEPTTSDDVVTAGAITASPISIRWQAKDFATATTAPTVTGTETAPISLQTTLDTSFATSLPSSYSSSTDSSSPDSNSLSGSARAGIGIGIFFAALFVGVAVRITKAYLKLPKAAKANSQVAAQSDPMLPSEFPDTAKPGELEAAISELPSDGPYHRAETELEESRWEHELDIGANGGKRVSDDVSFRAGDDVLVELPAEDVGKQRGHDGAPVIGR